MTPGSAAKATRPRLIQALLDPTVYPHPVNAVELVETHISWVFLAGERVYKVKKPVDLGFLDFTTLGRRRRFCEEEVRLNRRLAADTYLGVVELRRGPSGIRLGGPGRTVEVAVEMRRLPADRMLDRLVADGRAQPGLMRDLAGVVARFHAEAETGGSIDEMGGADVLRRNWDENFDQTANVAADVWPPDERRRLRAYADGFLARADAALAARVRDHRIRDCHGDLQAQHVCCVDPVQIFDCIEFNPRFRFGDTAGEIAFLAMDLERLGAPALATEFINGYLDETGDYEAVRLLDFYRAYRAFVRAKVMAFQIAERPGLVSEARALFALAGRFARPRAGGRLILITGVMGSGKSTVARRVAAALGAVVIRTDVVRKRLGGIGLHERAPAAFGEGLYTADMSRRTYEEALRLAAALARDGWPIVLDGSFSHAAERETAREAARALGVSHATLWCDAPDHVIAGRLARRSGDVSDGRVELLAEHRAGYEAPEGEPGVLEVSTADDGVDVERILRGLERLPSAPGG